MAEFLKTVPGTMVSFGFRRVTFSEPDGTSHSEPYPEGDDYVSEGDISTPK